MLWLTDIHGIGPKKAGELIEKGIRTVEDLRKQQDELLNDKQKIGLQYYEDINKKIPRDEIDQYKELCLIVNLKKLHKMMENMKLLEVIDVVKRCQVTLM